jgi:hypothetical protein
MEARTITPTLLTQAFPAGVDLITTGPPNVDSTLATGTQGTRVTSPRRYLTNKPLHPAPRHNPRGRNWICMGRPRRIPTTRTCPKHDGALEVLNASKYGSGAHRPTHVWQNLLPKEELDEAYSNLTDPPRTVNDVLDLVGLGGWRMPTEDTPNSLVNPTKALPRFGTRHTLPP